MTKTYSEMLKHRNFEDRFRYLRLYGVVGVETFGYDRYLNQRFYKSVEWKTIRDFVISRDFGLDMGVIGYEIPGRILVHHMNPISIDDVLNGGPTILDPEFLISVSHNTHNAIHYGDEKLLPTVPIERYPGDTTPWL